MLSTKSQTSKIKLGIIGCGGVAHLIHGPIFEKKLQNLFEVSGVFDIDYNRAKSFVLCHKYAQVFNCPFKLMESDLDLILVLTPNHEKYIEYCIKNNKNLFTEKPISLDYHYTQKLIDLAINSNIKFYVGLQRIFDNNFKRFLKLFKKEEILHAKFSKIDGTDILYRTRLLPQNFSAYNINHGEILNIPQNVSKRQINFIKMLLWECTHMLTSLISYFDEIKPLYSTIDDNAQSLSIVFDCGSGKTIYLHSSRTSVKIYHEIVELFTHDKIGQYRFCTPYDINAQTSFDYTTSFHSRNITFKQEFIEDSFIQMWYSIYEDIKKIKEYDFITSAKKVEKIAYEAMLLVK